MVFIRPLSKDSSMGGNLLQALWENIVFLHRGIGILLLHLKEKNKQILASVKLITIDLKFKPTNLFYMQYSFHQTETI